jgi:DNA-binding protein HU-beta
MATKKKMTQTELIKEIGAKCEVSNKAAKLFLSGYAEIAVRETKKNGVFVMPGLGRLVRVDRKARMGRNPATGEKIKIPAKKVVRFRVAKAVKDAIVPPKK